MTRQLHTTSSKDEDLLLGRELWNLLVGPPKISSMRGRSTGCNMTYTPVARRHVAAEERQSASALGLAR